MNSTITVTELKQHRGSQLIDVRSASEFAAAHISGAISIPMDQIEGRLDDLDPERPLVLICKTGKRARMTAGLLAPCRPDSAVLEGGTDAWIKEGLPIVFSTKTRWALERQVRLGAGLLVLTGVVLSTFHDPRWIWLSAFVGAGLTFAGLTDICMMGSLLARMSWNRTPRVRPAATDQAKRRCAL
jgi:rhodanese-related sulfurtransferase